MSVNRYFYLTNPWWSKKNFKSGISRPLYIKKLKRDIDSKLIQIITGLRRVGKSTIILQLIKSLIKENKVNPYHILFFSVEEPSIAKTPISNIINEYRTEHQIKSHTKIYVFIDEIQFRKGWEQEIKSLYDTENIKFILTGSSAMLLSEKLSYLTGRYLKLQVHPLNFREYLNFHKVKTTKTDQHLLIKHAENYLIDGGMPEYVLQKPNKYLETTVESILFKDLVSKFQLRNPSILMDLIYLLADRISTTSSSLKLSKILEINKDTVLTYVDYLNKTFITSELPNHSTSRNKQIYNPAKIYFSDTGIGSKYASKDNMGALAENSIYNHLKNKVATHLRTRLGYFYEDKQEIDFVLTNKGKTYFIESKWVDRLDQINFSPLKKALKVNNVTSVTYVTRSLETTEKIDGYKITFVPLYKFLSKKLNLID